VGLLGWYIHYTTAVVYLHAASIAAGNPIRLPNQVEAAFDSRRLVYQTL